MKVLSRRCTTCDRIIVVQRQSKKATYSEFTDAEGRCFECAAKARTLAKARKRID